MFTIAKDFTFSASHILHGLPVGHQCGRMHGHNYRVQMVLCADQLDSTGFVRDFGDLAPVKQYIDKVLDHRHLNDVLVVQPSAENIALHLFERFKPIIPELCAVRVWETEKCWAEYHE